MSSVLDVKRPTSVLSGLSDEVDPDDIEGPPRNILIRLMLALPIYTAMHPDSEIRTQMDILYFIAGAYSLFAALFLVCFSVEPSTVPFFLVASGLADGSFIVDLILRVNTGFVRTDVSGKTVVVQGRVAAVWHYLVTWLPIDALVAIPVTSLQFAIFDPNSPDTNPIATTFLRTVHLGKLLCMLRMQYTFLDWRRKNPSRFVEVSRGSSVVSILVLAHVLACLWFVTVSLTGLPPDNLVDYYAATDADECILHTHDCDPAASCVNSAGSFSCVCDPGLMGNGTECYDCASYPSDFARLSCAAYASAIHSPVFSARLPPSLSALAGQVVNDVDECLEKTHDCDPWHGVCRNTPGSFQCYCDTGFQGDGVECHGCADHESVVQYMSWSEQYACSVYWAIQHFTHVGYGDVSAATHGERALSTLLALLLVPLAAFLLAAVKERSGGGFSPYHRFLHARRARLGFATDRGIPPASRAKLSKMLDHHWSQDKGLPDDDMALLPSLPPGVRVVVFRLLHAPAFAGVPFFGDKTADLTFWRFLLQRCQVETFLPGEILVKEGVLEEEMCFMKAGIVQEVDSETGEKKRTRRRPAHWGTGALLKAVSGTKRFAEATIRAKTTAQVFMLDMRALGDLVARDVDVRGLVKGFVDDEMQAFISRRFQVLSKKAFSLHLVKAAEHFREHQREKDGLRPRANGRLR